MNISTKQNVIRIILAIITGIHVCAFMAAGLAGVLSFSQKDSVISFVFVSYPIIIAGSMALVWKLYRFGKFGLALLATLLPIGYFLFTNFFILQLR